MISSLHLTLEYTPTVYIFNPSAQGVKVDTKIADVQCLEKESHTAGRFNAIR